VVTCDRAGTSGALHEHVRRSFQKESFMNQLGVEVDPQLITVRAQLEAFGLARRNEFAGLKSLEDQGVNSTYASYEIAVQVHAMVRQDAKLKPQQIDQLKNWIDREARNFEPSTIERIGDVDLAKYRIGASIATWVNVVNPQRAAQSNVAPVSISGTAVDAQACLSKLCFDSADLRNGKEGEEASRPGLIAQAVGGLTAQGVLLSPRQADELVCWIQCEAKASPNDPTEHQRVGSIATWLNSLQ
jgi:hypothetical protein